MDLASVAEREALLHDFGHVFEVKPWSEVSCDLLVTEVCLIVHVVDKFVLHAFGNAEAPGTSQPRLHRSKSTQAQKIT